MGDVDAITVNRQMHDNRHTYTYKLFNVFSMFSIKVMNKKIKQIRGEETKKYGLVGSNENPKKTIKDLLCLAY